MGRWFWLGLLALWLWWGPLAPAWATAVTDLPPSPPATPVLDEADVFSPSTLKQVNRTLTQLAKDTGFQVHVVSLRRLDYGETASSFGEKLFQRWFPDGGARQVLLTVVARTATGDLQAGSEAAARLSPATAVSIVQDTLLKPVRNNVYNQALLDTVARLQAVLSGQPDPGPPRKRWNV